MKVYTDITLLPNADISHYFLWEKVFQQVHLGLASQLSADDSSAIAVAMPEYDADKNHLGSKLRLLAPEESYLEKLDIRQYLSRLADYVHVTGIRPVPDKDFQHCVYRRLQPKSSNERMARRKAKRQGITLEEARKQLAGREEAFTRLPFVNMKSQTTGQRFRLFIDRQLADQPVAGHFSSYGLSHGATVPDF